MIDPGLEKKTFMHAGQILAEIWSGMIIDSHPVLAKYMNEKAEEEILKKSLEWKSNHIGESKYFFQIVKCQDKNCSRPFHSNYLKIIMERFLPLPAHVAQSTY